MCVNSQLLMNKCAEFMGLSDISAHCLAMSAVYSCRILQEELGLNIS